MQVFAGHTGALQCGEFTPDGFVRLPSPVAPRLTYME